MSGVKVKILPPRKIVKRIVDKRGKFAWDMYGVAHPDAQKYLKRVLEQVIKREFCGRFS